MGSIFANYLFTTENKMKDNRRGIADYRRQMTDDR
jgi:hypothetical protein